MADSSILEKYPVVQLLDNLNNPVSPAVQIDSLYEDPGTKNPLDVIYKYDSVNLGIGNLHVAVREDGGTGLIQRSYSNNEPDTSAGIAPQEVYIVTDTWAGDGPNDASVYSVDNTLHVRKYNASDFLTYWFEHDYLSKQAGAPIYFGTCNEIPDAINTEVDMTNDSAGQYVSNIDTEGDVTSIQAYHPVFNNSLTNAEWYYGKTETQDGLERHTAIYKVIDFNTTNFFAPDLYPKRGTINPSGEYIWFVIKDVIPRSGSVKLYGFSGEDSPQEIDITPINNMQNAWRSTGKFGIDTRFNIDSVDSSNNPYNRGNDGLSYHIFVKYTA